jgi:alpha-tubulin suppressor-like RCC1 family protein
MTKIRICKALVLTLVVSLWAITQSYGQTNCYSSSGCSDYRNFGYNSTTAGTLEYDNYVSSFHSTVVRDIDGSFKVWGEQSKANGVDSWLVPTPLNAGNYPGLTGTPLKVAIGSGSINSVQYILLTSDNKLWVWGTPGVVFNTTLKSTNAFAPLALGLPAGVTAANVKMMFANWEGFMITTCDGSVYSIMQYWGNAGTTASTTDAWVKVQKSAAFGGGDLTDIVAARGGGENTYMALDKSGSLWTWGARTWNGSTTASVMSQTAVRMSLPAGATGNIKMIGVSTDQGRSSYYVLYENGNLYALGDNSKRQLGNWTTTNATTWVQPTYSLGGAVMNNIRWISPNEHSNTYANINVLTNNMQIYNWGAESGYDLGRGIQAANSSETSVDPGPPTQFQGSYTNNNVIAIESGGHTTMALKLCESNFGYVGHRVNGSMGDNTTVDNTDNIFHFTTNAVQVCGAQTVNAKLDASVNGPYCMGNTVQLIGTPSGGTYAIDAANSTATATLSGTTLTFTGAGTLRVNYTVNDGGDCGTVTVSKVFVVENCGAKVTIPGTIWNDADGDAVIDGSEAGMANGLWANLTDPNGNVIASVQVNTNGTYSFQLATSYLAASGNYSVVLTNSAKQVGDPLANADTPNGGYGYTGVNRGATGVNNTNRTGKLNIGNLSTVAGGTSTNPVNFGISNNPLVLPVQFADLSATIRGGVLFVNWTTAAEKNNKNFEIEASADGVHFTTIGSADSKALNGNSDTALSYEFSADLSGVAMATSGFIVALLALGALTMGLQRRRKLLLAGLMLAGISVGTIGCQKKGSEPVSDGKSAYIRIAQIDQNGSKTYSKIVKVINN